jgi:flagellar basal body-associated protein FliL
MRFERIAGISRSVLLGIIVTVIVVAVAGFFIVAQMPSTGPVTTVQRTPTFQTTTEATSPGTETRTQTMVTIETTTTTLQTTPPQTTTQTTPTTKLPTEDQLRTFFNNYLNVIQKRDVISLIERYTQDAVAYWTGQAGGLKGTYRGQGNIRILYIAALGTAKSITLKEESFATKYEGDVAVIESTQAISGNSDILGNFDGKVKITLKVRLMDGQLKIVEETWDYLTFNYEKTGGATTFPQWADIKAGKPIALEPTKDFKDLVWETSSYFAYGLAAFATITAIMAVKRFRR